MVWWFLWNARFVKLLQVDLNKLKINCKNIWVNIWQVTCRMWHPQQKVLNSKWHLLTRTSNMFVILSYSMFTSLCQFFNNLTMLWLERIDVRLFNLPPFSMFCKMGGPCLNMRFCNSCFNLWSRKSCPKSIGMMLLARRWVNISMPKFWRCWRWVWWEFNTYQLSAMN